MDRVDPRGALLYKFPKIRGGGGGGCLPSSPLPPPGVNYHTLILGGLCGSINYSLLCQNKHSKLLSTWVIFSQIWVQSQLSDLHRMAILSGYSFGIGLIKTISNIPIYMGPSSMVGSVPFSFTKGFFQAYSNIVKSNEPTFFAPSSHQAFFGNYPSACAIHDRAKKNFACWTLPFIID